MPETKDKKIVGKSEGVIALVFFFIAVVLGLISQ